MFSYILNVSTFTKGKLILSNFYRNLNIGNYIPLHQAPYGLPVYNMELKLGCGGKIARSAGSFVKIINKFLVSE